MHATTRPLHVSLTNGMRLLAVNRYSGRAGEFAPAHRHGMWKIAFYWRGKVRARIDEAEHDIAPGTVLALRPGAVHSELAITDYVNTFLLVDAPAAWPWPLRCNDDGTRGLQALYTTLQRESASPDEHSGSVAGAVLTQLDVALRRAHGAHVTPAESVVRAAEEVFLLRHSTPVRMDEVAAEAGVSTATLRHYFARLRGMTPGQRLREIRLAHALSLLATSNLTLEAVAYQSGYHSASHLSRRVKAATGRSPGAYRAAKRVASPRLTSVNPISGSVDAS